MKKLSPAEATERQRERVRKQNDKAKLERVKRKVATGNISRLTEARKKQMREYIRTKRGKPVDDKLINFLNLTPQELERKRKDDKNAKARAKREAEREAGFRVDKRLKTNRSKPHYKTLSASPKKKRKPQTAKVKKMGKVIPEPKPLLIKNSSVEGKVKLVISPKLTVYIKPGQDVEAVRAKYLKNFNY